MICDVHGVEGCKSKGCKIWGRGLLKRCPRCDFVLIQGISLETMCYYLYCVICEYEEEIERLKKEVEKRDEIFGKVLLETEAK